MSAERSSMAEYLSPGVYVEEFDSGVKAMEGVGTSTAGFVGMAQKGPVKGTPVLLTSMRNTSGVWGAVCRSRLTEKCVSCPMRWNSFLTTEVPHVM